MAGMTIERLKKQKGANNFGGAFWLLEKPCSGAEFMNYPGYSNTDSKGKSPEVFQENRRKNMRDHLREWNKVCCTLKDDFKLTLLLNGIEWDGKTMWKETDTLYCPQLAELHNMNS